MICYEAVTGHSADSAPRRGPINPNLTCVWSQCGRGSRPGGGETARVHGVAPYPRQRTLGTLRPRPSSEPAGQSRVRLPLLFNLPSASSALTSPGHFSSLLRTVIPHCTRRVGTSPGTAKGPQVTGQRPGKLSVVPGLLRASPQAFPGFCDFLEKNTCWLGQVSPSAHGSDDNRFVYASELVCTRPTIFSSH